CTVGCCWPGNTRTANAMDTRTAHTPPDFVRRACSGPSAEHADGLSTFEPSVRPPGRDRRGGVVASRDACRYTAGRFTLALGLVSPLCGCVCGIEGTVIGGAGVVAVAGLTSEERTDIA